MAMHAIHKIMASASGRDTVSVGEIINVNIDVAGINDIYLLVLKSFEEMGGSSVWDPQKVVFFFDHNAPSGSINAAENQKTMREFARKQGIPHVFEINRGICHTVLPEAGMVEVTVRVLPVEGPAQVALGRRPHLFPAVGGCRIYRTRPPLRLADRS